MSSNIDPEVCIDMTDVRVLEKSLETDGDDQLEGGASPSQTMCVICMQQMDASTDTTAFQAQVEDMELVSLQCQHAHAMHKECLRQWTHIQLTRSGVAKCPMCRMEYSQTPSRVSSARSSGPQSRPPIDTVRDARLLAACTVMIAGSLVWFVTTEIPLVTGGLRTVAYVMLLCGIGWNSVAIWLLSYAWILGVAGVSFMDLCNNTCSPPLMASPCVWSYIMDIVTTAYAAYVGMLLVSRMNAREGMSPDPRTRLGGTSSTSHSISDNDR